MSKIVTNQISPRSGDTVTVTSKLNVQGVLSYEDVSNIDAVGIVTAQSGVRIPAGGLTVSGVSTFSSDASIADKIVHTGDTDTAIRFPAADTFSVETAGSERVRIDSSGRLMIGTTTEGEAHADDFTVASSGNTGITIRSGTSNYNSIYFSDATSGAGEYDAWIQYHTGTGLQSFGNNGLERLTIDSSGNVTATTGTISDSKGDVRDIPQSSNSSQRTLVATDNGKVVMTSSGGWVLPTGVMSQGNTVTLLNGDGSAQNIDASALNALYNTADGANIKANTISLGGASMATIWFGSGTFAYISATNMTVS